MAGLARAHNRLPALPPPPVDEASPGVRQFESNKPPFFPSAEVQEPESIIVRSPEPIYLFWRNLILTVARQLGLFIIKPSHLKTLWFNRGGLSPLCLDDVLVTNLFILIVLCNFSPNPKLTAVHHRYSL